MELMMADEKVDEKDGQLAESLDIALVAEKVDSLADWMDN
jgi:hypothetical protein